MGLFTRYLHLQWGDLRLAIRWDPSTVRTVNLTTPKSGKGEVHMAEGFRRGYLFMEMGGASKERTKEGIKEILVWMGAFIHV